MSTTTASTQALINSVAAKFAELPQAVAVVHGGSQRRDVVDIDSDVDLFVYVREETPLATRQSIVAASGGASQANLGMDFWGASDEWFDNELTILSGALAFRD